MQEHNVYINHLFTPMPVGGLVEMHKWPPHVTLAGNFFTTAALEHVLAMVQAVCESTPPIHTSITGEAQFGAAGEYRVLLLDYTPTFREFHEALALLVEGPLGTFEVPQFVHEGYRPHTTIQPTGNALTVGDRLLIDSATVFDIDADLNTRTVLATFPLAG